MSEKTNNLTPPFLMIIFSNLIVIFFFFGIFYAIKLPSFLLCTDPAAQNLIFSIIAVLCLHFFSGTIQTINSSVATINGQSFFTLLGTQVIAKKYKLLLLLVTVIIFSAFWLGSRKFSPLDIGDRDIPILRGFTISMPGLDSTSLLVGQAFQIRNDGIASIKVISETEDVECSWVSNFGSFGNNRKCEVSYIPPLDSAYDVIEVQVKPFCQSQESHAHILVEIIP